MTEESKIEVPNFEATSDGKKIFTPKQWLERFRQYAKRKHKMDITELIRGAEMTNRLGRKRSRNPRRLHMGNRHRSFIPNDTSGV